jgi:hypothetical protein
MSAGLRGLTLALVVVVVGCNFGSSSSPHASPTPSPVLATVFRPFMGAAEIPQPGWTKASAGTATHTCVDVGDEALYRSGDFASSLNSAFAQAWRQHPDHAKVVWIPRDPTQGPLRLHADREGGGTYEEDLGFAASYANGTGYFWPDIPSVHQPGHWTFKLTAGSEWGCFVIDL